jgi:hypothetical protein
MGRIHRPLRVKAGQPHRAHNGDPERVRLLLEGSSTVMRLPSASRKPSLSSLRCGQMSRPHFRNFSTSPCSSLMTTAIFVSFIQATKRWPRASSCSSLTLSSPFSSSAISARQYNLALITCSEKSPLGLAC